MLSDDDFENIKKDFKPTISKFNLALELWKKQKIMLANLANLLLLKIKNYLLFAMVKILLIENIIPLTRIPSPYWRKYR